MSGCFERWTAAFVFFALFVCVTSPLPAGPLPATGVLDALAEPDGSAVSLKAVSVQKTVTALVRDQRGDPVGAGVPVTLVTDNGVFGNPPGSSQYATQTAADGTVSVDWTPASCPGTATITATASAQPCNATFTDSRTVQIYCEDPGFIDVFFCIDVSGSTQDGALIATGVSACVDALATGGVNVRVGGLKFTDYLVEPYYDFTLDYTAFKQWVQLPGAGGGGSPGEQQLAALVRAADVAPGAYVALATDEPYAYNPGVPSLTAQAVREVLIAAGVRVFIDAAGATYGDPYSIPPFPGYDNPVNLAVNGSIESLLGTFTFPLLRAAVIGGN